MNYVVAGQHSWSERAFKKLERGPGSWTYVSSPGELTLERLAQLDPHRIFFLHWSWIVPVEILDKYVCIGFHVGDLPYGRGGTPVQNLIIRGVKETKLTAFRMVEELDAGPIYMQHLIPLDGTAQEIYERAAFLAYRIITALLAHEPVPTPQVGDPVVFKRRMPADSEIPELDSLEKLFDFVRMLDAEDYPRAFIRYKGFRLEFTGAGYSSDRVKALVQITKEKA